MIRQGSYKLGWSAPAAPGRWSWRSTNFNKAVPDDLAIGCYLISRSTFVDPPSGEVTSPAEMPPYQYWYRSAIWVLRSET